MDERLHTSMTGMDYGSTYHLISCVKCQTALGRMYRTTTPELDLWRGQYTFSSDLLAFYEISAPIPSPTAPPTSAVVPSAAPGKGERLGGVTSVLADVEIAKVQKFCLYLHDRIKSLEEALELRRSGGQESPIRATTNSTVDRPPGKRGRSQKRPPSPQAAGPWAPPKDPAAPNPDPSRPKSIAGPIRKQKTDMAAPSPAAPPPPPAPFTTHMSASAPATPLAAASEALTIPTHNSNEQPIKRGRGRPRKHFPPSQVPPPITPAAQDAVQPAPAHAPPVAESPFCPAPV